jgi:hypothetical protein
MQRTAVHISAATTAYGRLNIYNIMKKVGAQKEQTSKGYVQKPLATKIQN